MIISEFLANMLFANIPNNIVTNHSELEKAATCMTLLILLVGVPLRRNKSKKNKNLDIIPNIKFDDKVFLLKYYPGLTPLLIENVQKLGYKVIIIEGTGLGHINKNFFSSLKEVISSGILVFMTSQCIWGRTNLNVYDTGRDLERIGVISLYNMLSETATVKAMWLLANSNNLEYIKNKMQENISNEITYITPIVDDVIS